MWKNGKLSNPSGLKVQHQNAPRIDKTQKWHETIERCASFHKMQNSDSKHVANQSKNWNQSAKYSEAVEINVQRRIFARIVATAELIGDWRWKNR